MQLPLKSGSWSVRKKLIVLIMALTLPSFGLLISAHLARRNTQIQSAARNVQLLVESLATQQEEVSHESKMMLTTLARLPEVQRLDAEACRQIFQDLIEQYPFYTTIGLATPDGNLYADAKPFSSGKVNLSEQKHIQDAIRTRDFSVGEYIVGKVSKLPTLHYSYPVVDPDGTLRGVVIAGFNLNEYASFVTNAGLPENSAVSIVDHKGVRLYRFPGNGAASPGKPIPEDALAEMSGEMDGGMFERVSDDGIQRLYVFKRLHLSAGVSPYLYVVAGIAKEELSHAANLDMIRDLSALAIIALLAMGFIWFMANLSIVKPLSRLVAAAQHLGGAHMHTRSGLAHTPDELGLLARTFDEMAASLEKRETERKEAQAALQKQYELQRVLLGTIPACVYIKDTDSVYLAANKEFSALCGRPENEIPGKTDYDFFPTAVADSFRKKDAEVIASGQARPNYEEKGIDPNGHEVWFSTSKCPFLGPTGEVAGLVGICMDITDRKRAEEERAKYEKRLYQAQKAESLALMAGAIAHNFNNMLSVVIGNLEFALDDAPVDSELRSSIDEAMAASRRAAQISRFMLTYVGQSDGKAEPIDAAKAVRDICAFLKISLPASVQMSTDFPATGPIVKAVRDHLTQILTNLIRNAAEAIGEQQGEITVKIDVLPGGEFRKLDLLPLEWEPGEEDYACFSIGDTGGGIDQADLDRIFDPFFSTKFLGRGLGLPMVLGLARTCGGAVSVENNPVRGATFKVFLPVFKQRTSPLPKDGDAHINTAANNGLALLVEDDPVLRILAEDMLKRKLGFEVLTASQGQESIEIFRDRSEDIDLVLLDIVMPVMNGWETLTALRAIRPDIPVVITSGFDERGAITGNDGNMGYVFLPKPFGLDDLKRAILSLSGSADFKCPLPGEAPGIAAVSMDQTSDSSR